MLAAALVVHRHPFLELVPEAVTFTSIAILHMQFQLRNFELKPHLISHVAGKKSKWCQYPLAYNELVPNNAPKNADILPVQCIYCVHNHDEEKADCRGTDCPPCLAQTVRLIVMRVIMRQQLE